MMKYYRFGNVKPFMYICCIKNQIMTQYERNTEIESYDDYFDAVWDYVPIEVVSDKFWADNQDLIRQISFDMYRFDKQRGNLDIMTAAKRLEIIFSALTAFKIK